MHIANRRASARTADVFSRVNLRKRAKDPEVEFLQKACGRLGRRRSPDERAEVNLPRPTLGATLSLRS